jgi:hypothetical protein
MTRTLTPVLMQFGQVVADEAPQQTHQIVNLRGRARPVLGAEREDGEDGDAQVPGRADRLAQGLDAAAMPLSARQAARGRPSSIAVHDDGDMTRHRECRQRGSGLGHRHGDFRPS